MQLFHGISRVSRVHVDASVSLSQYAVARTLKEVMTRCEAFAAVMNVKVFWNMMLCRLAVGQ